jgi:hypothetical protein
MPTYVYVFKPHQSTRQGIGLGEQQREFALANHLETCQSYKLIINHFKDTIKARYCKDSFRCGRKTAENQSVTAVTQQLTKPQQFRETGRSYDVNAGEINDQVAVTAIAEHLRDRGKFISHLRLTG